MEVGGREAERDAKGKWKERVRKEGREEDEEGGREKGHIQAVMKWPGVTFGQRLSREERKRRERSTQGNRERN